MAISTYNVPAQTLNQYNADLRAPNSKEAPITELPAEPQERVTLGGTQLPGIFQPFQNGTYVFKRERKLVTQNGSKVNTDSEQSTSTTQNGVTTTADSQSNKTDTNRVYGQTTRGGGVTLTDNTRRELNSEGQILGMKTKSQVYQESNTTVYGKGTLTTNKGRSGNLDAGFGASQEDKVGVRTEVELAKNVNFANQNEVSTKGEGKANVNSTIREEKGDYENSTKIDVVGAVEVKNTNTQQLTLGDQKKGITFSNINENKASADFHVQAEDTLIANKNKFLLKKDVDFSQEANVGTKNTWKVDTTNGSSFESSGDASVSQGLSFKGGVTLGRDNETGTTEVGFKLGGPIPVAPFIGVGKEYKVKLADKDLDTLIDVTNPLMPTVVKDQIKKTTKGALSTIPTVASAVTDRYVASKKAVVNRTSQAVRKTYNDVKQTTRRVITRGTQTYNQGRKWVGDKVQQGRTYVNNTYNRVSEGVSNTYNRVSQGVSNTYNQVSEGVSSTYNAAKSYIGSWWSGK